MLGARRSPHSSAATLLSHEMNGFHVREPAIHFRLTQRHQAAGLEFAHT